MSTPKLDGASLTLLLVGEDLAHPGRFYADVDLDEHGIASRIHAGLRLVHQGIEDRGERCTAGTDGSAPRRFPERRA